MNAGPTAHPIIDGGNWAVGLDLNPITLAILPDLARLLQNRPQLAWRFRMLAKRSPASVEYRDMLNHLRDDPDLQALFLIPLHPTQAEALAAGLDEAGTEPDLCRGLHGDCPSYATRGDLCDVCVERAEAVSDQIRGLR